MTGSATPGGPEAADVTRVSVVDSDVHPSVTSVDEFKSYIPAEFRDRWTGKSGTMFWPPNEALRYDAKPASGAPAGSDPDLMEKQLLGEAGVDYAILLPLFSGQYLIPELDAAIRGALNQWMADTWLSQYNHHSRYYGTVAISMINPKWTAAELDRLADHPHVIAAQAGPIVPSAFGDERYDPIWAELERRNLPLMMHINTQGTPLPPLSPVGSPEHYIEYHAIGHSLTYAAHLMSMVCQGTFEKFPNLRMVFVEGGAAWLGPLMWRLDHHWEAMRREVPYLTRKPSEYIYDNVRFTSQPLEDLGNGRQLTDLLNIFEADRLMMFATDYPHWDFDDPKRAVPRGLSSEARDRIMFGNACELFRLPAVRPSGEAA
jgi:uncharacterized protein